MVSIIVMSYFLLIATVYVSVLSIINSSKMHIVKIFVHYYLSLSLSV